MGGLVAEAVVGEVEGFVDDASKVSVGECVDDPPPLFAANDETTQAKPGEVLADGRSLGPAALGQRGDVRFRSGEGVEDAQARAVAEESEEFRGEGELFLAAVMRVRILCI
ncbi:hypothetical protein AN216_19180 [Streptomyces oceani]|uniref:Uncharacterized protein n=1 Tax=Streptomyces oceani TaxID=1075402 RepID=A0A1E7JYG8_9ACTN|nr:hypothetical protein AN216_19180 [Streptomyces oceani]